jgi:hypothetical protein
VCEREGERERGREGERERGRERERKRERERVLCVEGWPVSMSPKDD